MIASDVIEVLREADDNNGPSAPRQKSETPLPIHRIFAVKMDHRTMFLPKSEVEKADGSIRKRSRTASKVLRLAHEAGKR
jgi:hypothetical protein